METHIQSCLFHGTHSMHHTTPEGSLYVTCPEAFPHHSKYLALSFQVTHLSLGFGDQDNVKDNLVSRTIDSYLGSFTTGWCSVAVSVEHCWKLPSTRHPYSPRGTWKKHRLWHTDLPPIPLPLSVQKQFGNQLRVVAPAISICPPLASLCPPPRAMGLHGSFGRKGTLFST